MNAWYETLEKPPLTPPSWVFSPAALLFLFWPASDAAALLLAPYMAWVLFATYLNYGFFRLN